VRTLGDRRSLAAHDRDGQCAARLDKRFALGDEGFGVNDGLSETRLVEEWHGRGHGAPPQATDSLGEEQPLDAEDSGR
jgi:hypothetical protein